MVDPDEQARVSVARRVRSIAATPNEKARLSERSGVPASTLDRLIRGENNPSLGNLIKVAAGAGVSLDWLVGREAEVKAYAERVSATVSADRIRDVAARYGFPAGDGEGTSTASPPAESTSMMPSWVPVPMLTVQASAGPGVIAAVQAEAESEVVSFREDWLRSLGLFPGRAEAMTAVGDSMEPTIRDGDLLLVDRSIDRVVNHGIYVLVYNGAVLVKRVQVRLDGSMMLMSDNERYREELVPAHEATELMIEGRVRWFGRKI